MEPQLNSEIIFWIYGLNASNLDKKFKNIIQNYNVTIYETQKSLNPYAPLVYIWKLSKLRNLYAHLHAICYLSIIKSKVCLQKCRRSSRKKSILEYFTLWSSGLHLEKFRNSETFMRIYKLYAIII